MLLKNEVKECKLDDIATSSAGLFAKPGTPPDPKMVEYLSKIGISKINHEARRIKKKDVDWADLILVMEKEHSRMIERMWPDVKEKVGLMGRFVSEGDDADDIVDPFGRTSYHYRLAQSQIILAIRSLLKKIDQKALRR